MVRGGLRLIFLFAWIALGVAAQARTLTVLAAASLREVCTEFARQFERSHPGDHVRITFAGSQQLAAQILLDAPADVFLSADEAQMNRVVMAGKAKRGSPLCSNSLIIAVNVAAAGRVASLADLGRPGIRVVLAKPQVPAGAYAEKVLAKLSPAQAAAIRANVRSREVDVRTVLTRVELGEADAGIVYATDIASAGGKVRSVVIDRKLQTPVTYLISTLSISKAPDMAAAFVDLAVSPKGQAILHAHGFLPARRP